MERVADGYRDLIARGRALVPARIRERLDHVHFFAGYDPVAAGLVTPETMKRLRWAAAIYVHANEEGQGHLYRDQRHPTIILLPGGGIAPRTIAHEYGHALDFHADEPSQRLDFPTFTAYACRDRWEAFAEAFMLWCLRRERPRVERSAPALVGLFRSFG